MESEFVIQTERLILRPWREEDLKPFAEMSSDPRVMEFFPSVLSREESDRFVRRFQKKMEENGWGLWVVSIRGGEPFIGFIGLNPLDKESFPVHFSPCVEIGWRLAADYWKKGYATEGATACLNYGFNSLALDEIVAFTAKQNLRSMKVMERIGMHNSQKDDFDNPNVPEGHQLRRHVLYRLSRREWQQNPA